jgi:hypothetical protein
MEEIVKALQPLALTTLALTMACLPSQPKVSPEPRLAPVRVTSETGQVYQGPVVRLDSLQLDVFDLNPQTRFTVLAGDQAVVEVYRGQRQGADVVAKGAGRGALFGAGAGLFAAVVAKVAYGSVINFGEASRLGVTAGIISGGIDGAGEAAVRGAPAWERVTVRALYQERSQAGPSSR